MKEKQSVVQTNFLNSGAIFSSSSPSFSSSLPLIKDELWIGWGNALRTPHPLPGFSWYAPDFFLKDEKPWWSFSQVTRVHRSELRDALQSFLEQDSESAEPKELLLGNPFSRIQWLPPDFDFFRSSFEELQNQFQSGNLKKAVPFVFETASLASRALDIRRKALLLWNLLESTQDVPLHLYGVWDQEEGILGASPEILFQKNIDGPLHTVALAGTRYKGDTRGSLLEDPKELEEHQWVIEGIRASLSGLGELKVGKTRVLDLPTLSHLCTPIQLELSALKKGQDVFAFFESVVSELHPTPALGAFPRAEGRVWLEKFQTRIDRNRFGAPFGVVTDLGECHCIVGIRNLQWKAQTLQVGAGCGVIPASELNREWCEIQAKILSVKKLMGLHR